MKRSHMVGGALALVAIVFSSNTAVAQMCTGNAGFAAGPFQVGAAADFTDGAKGFGANLGYGAPRGFYGNLALSAVDYDGTNAGGTVVGLSGGYSLPVSSNKAEFCPIVGISHQSGPDAGNASLSVRNIAFGGAFGGVASSSPTFDFVPFASLAALITNATVKVNGLSASASDNYFELGVGAGFVMSKVITIQPRVSIPMGLQGAKASYGLAFAYNFGGATQTSAPQPPRRR